MYKFRFGDGSVFMGNSTKFDFFELSIFKLVTLK